MSKYNSKDVVYIPGWADLAEFYSEFEGRLEIWKDKIDPEKKTDAQIVVAHSLGTHFALLNWEKNRDTKLILINPLLKKKNLLKWFFIWFKFFLREGRKKVNPKRLSFIFHLPSLFVMTSQLFKMDFFSILKNIPKEDLLVIRGEKDYFFCGKELEEKIKNQGFEVLTIENMGHIWDKNIFPILDKKIEEFKLS